MRLTADRSWTVVSLLLLTTAAGPAASALDQWTSQGPYENGSDPAAIISLALDPVSSVLYAGSHTGDVYRSEDGGQTWGPPLPTPFPPVRIEALVVAPSIPDTVYAAVGAGEVWKSTDGGASWDPASDGLSGVEIVGDLAIDADVPSTLHAATSRGVFKSVDGAASWMPASVGLADGGEALYTYALAADPQTPTTLYAGTVRGLFVSEDGGGSWTRLEIPTSSPPAVSVVAVDPQTPSTLYASTFLSGQSRFWKSTDGGASWSQTGLGSLVRAVVIDPAVPSILYAGTSKKVFRSIDGGASWPSFSMGLVFGGGLHAMAIAGSDPTTVFAATDGGVFDVQVLTDPTVLELRAGRFRVEVDWRDFQNGTGQGKVAVAGADSGLFYFFSRDNWELLAKVLSGCAINDRFWVFGAATTNVEYTLRVTDTATGTVKSYHNSLGVASPAITDTQAFATCGAD